MNKLLILITLYSLLAGGLGKETKTFLYPLNFYPEGVANDRLANIAGTKDINIDDVTTSGGGPSVTPRGAGITSHHKLGDEITNSTTPAYTIPMTTIINSVATERQLTFFITFKITTKNTVLDTILLRSSSGTNRFMDLYIDNGDQYLKGTVYNNDNSSITEGQLKSGNIAKCDTKEWINAALSIYDDGGHSGAYIAAIVDGDNYEQNGWQNPSRGQRLRIYNGIGGLIAEVFEIGVFFEGYIHSFGFATGGYSGSSNPELLRLTQSFFQQCGLYCATNYSCLGFINMTDHETMCLNTACDPKCETPCTGWMGLDGCDKCKDEGLGRLPEPDCDCDVKKHWKDVNNKCVCEEGYGLDASDNCVSLYTTFTYLLYKLTPGESNRLENKAKATPPILFDKQPDGGTATLTEGAGYTHTANNTLGDSISLIGYYLLESDIFKTGMASITYWMAFKLKSLRTDGNDMYLLKTDTNIGINIYCDKTTQNITFSYKGPGVNIKISKVKCSKEKWTNLIVSFNSNSTTIGAGALSAAIRQGDEFELLTDSNKIDLIFTAATPGTDNVEIASNFNGLVHSFGFMIGVKDEGDAKNIGYRAIQEKDLSNCNNSCSYGCIGQFSSENICLKQLISTNGYCKKFEELVGCLECDDDTTLSTNQCLCNKPKYTEIGSTYKFCRCTSDMAYFYTSGSCTKCAGFGCRTCKDASTCLNCQTNIVGLEADYPCNCNASAYFKMNEVGTGCECMDGYYLSEQKCLKCGFGCATCTNGTECKTCKTAPGYLSTTPCGCNTQEHFKVLGDSCICEDGFWLTNDKCRSCGWTCNTCKDVTTCGSCAYKEGVAATPPCGCDIANGYFEDGEECSICSKGSYAIGNQCHACSETNVLCSDCTSGSSCTECVRDAEMIGGECKCRGGYEQDGHLCREEDDEDEYDKLNTIVVIVSLILLFCAALILVICIYCCKKKSADPKFTGVVNEDDKEGSAHQVR